MVSPRWYHTATALPKGKVLIAGGSSNSVGAELYDPSTSTFGATGPMINPGAYCTATLLPSGKVLIAGGINASASSNAELYDPSTGTFTATGSMVTPRENHTATLLPSGKVLIVGGDGDGGLNYELSNVELYDPNTGTFSSTGPLINDRMYHTATLLPNGKVLIAGGWANDNGIYSSAELYDPNTGTFSATGSMASPRATHTATLLPNGKVLLVGGLGPAVLSESELYDPDTGTFSVTGSMANARAYHTANLLPDGKVLIAGGDNEDYYPNLFIKHAELYDPSTGTFSNTGSLNTVRLYDTATLLPDGTVLFTGGEIGGNILTDTAELYLP
jgi:WD40 repeat protein